MNNAGVALLCPLILVLNEFERTTRYRDQTIMIVRRRRPVANAAQQLIADADDVDAWNDDKDAPGIAAGVCNAAHWTPAPNGT